MWIGKQMFDQRFYYDRQAKNLNFVFIVNYLEILALGANWTNFSCIYRIYAIVEWQVDYKNIYHYQSWVQKSSLLNIFNDFFPAVIGVWFTNNASIYSVWWL